MYEKLIITAQEMLFFELMFSAIRLGLVVGAGSFLGITSFMSAMRQEEYHMGGDPDGTFHR